MSAHLGCRCVWGGRLRTARFVTRGATRRSSSPGATHARPFSMQAGTFPTHARPFLTQAGTFPTHARPFLTQAGTFPTHARPFSTHARSSTSARPLTAGAAQPVLRRLGRRGGGDARAWPRKTAMEGALTPVARVTSRARHSLRGSMDRVRTNDATRSGRAEEPKG